jgi:hypothetical protein
MGIVVFWSKADAVSQTIVSARLQATTRKILGAGPEIRVYNGRLPSIRLQCRSVDRITTVQSFHVERFTRVLASPPLMNNLTVIRKAWVRWRWRAIKS